MRKLIVLTFMTLDGVMQAPGGPEEDPSGGFKFGGWSVPYFDEFVGKVMSEQMGHPFDLLLGRTTYDIFARFWPEQTDETGAAINRATKYVISHKPVKSDWKTTVHIGGDVAGEIRKLKSANGAELQVHGSGNLIQTLLKNDLVDELWRSVEQKAVVRRDERIGRRHRVRVVDSPILAREGDPAGVLAQAVLELGPDLA